MNGTGSRVTLAMIVRDEAGRYLRRALASHLAYIDEAVIVDDGSEDDTADVCLEALRDIPVHLVRNGQSMFRDESALRRQLWREAVGRRPDWLLMMDADEWFEAGAAEAIRKIAAQRDYDAIYFRLYDMWSETHYREDDYWQAHCLYRPMMFRYRPGIDYVWKETALHCGRLPETVSQFSYWAHPLRVQHFGWAKEEDRRRKYERYMELDGEGRFGWLAQYRSILDPNPRTLPWRDREENAVAPAPADPL